MGSGVAVGGGWVGADGGGKLGVSAVGRGCIRVQACVSRS